MPFCNDPVIIYLKSIGSAWSVYPVPISDPCLARNSAPLTDSSAKPLILLMSTTDSAQAGLTSSCATATVFRVAKRGHIIRLCEPHPLQARREQRLERFRNRSFRASISRYRRRFPTVSKRFSPPINRATISSTSIGDLNWPKS